MVRILRQVCFVRVGALVLWLAAVCVAGAGVAEAQATAPAVSMGSVAVGSSATATVTFTFSGSTTVSAVSVVTQGTTGLDFTLNSGSPGTCSAGTYSSSNTCTVGVQFTPLAPGIREGAVNLVNSSGVPVATGFVSGIGTDAFLQFAGASSKVVATVSAIAGLTVDGAGNIYYTANTASGHAYKLTPGGVTTTYPQYYGPILVGVDGAGDVFYVSSGATGTEAIGEVVGGVGSTPISFNYTSTGQIQGTQMGVDGAGNLYLPAPAGVTVLTPTGIGTYSQSSLATGLPYNVYAVNVDASGNIYVVCGDNTLRMISPDGSTITTIATLSSSVNSLAIDPAGNIYVGNSGSKQVLKFAAGTYAQSTIASGYNVGGIGTDTQGNLYVADTTNNRIVEYLRGTPVVTASAAVNGTSSETLYTVENDGNASGTIAAVSASGAAATGPSNTCTTGTFAVGATCTLSVEFAPTVHGPTPQSGTVTLSGNFPSATVTVSGTVPGDPNKLAFTTAPPLSVVGGTSAGTVVVTEEDASGNTATGDTSAPITLTITGTDGSSSVYGPVNATNSVATFNTSSFLLNAGATYTFTATSSGLTSATANAYASVNLGSSSGTLIATLTVTTAGTQAGFNVLTQGVPFADYAYVSGGTCTNGTTYTVGQTCTVFYTFTPQGPGPRLGGISLTDSSNNVLATALLSEVGTGPLAVAYPGTQSNAINVVSATPFQLVADVQGNLYLGNYTANTVTKYTLSGGSYTPTTIASGLNTVAGIGVDGLGNVFIADGQNDRILKETWSATAGTYTQTVAFSLPGAAWGVAVDGSGNIYLSTPTAVYKETLNPATGTYTQSIVDNASGFSLVTSIAVDQYGNLYLSDSSQNKLFKETYANGTYTRSTIDSGFSNCAQVAIDASGAVYTVSNGSNGGFRYAPLGNGTYSKMQIGFAISSPNGIAVDSAGNLYISENSSGNFYIVKLDVADPLTLTFGATAVSSSSAPQQFTLANEGNATLTLGSGTNPVIGADFTLNAGSTCPSSGGTLGSGLTCIDSISFAPTTTGVLTESLAYTDNNLNVSNATQSYTLVGGQAGTLSVTSSHSPSSFFSGSTGTYTLTVTNTSSSATSGTIVVTDILPSGFTATAMTGSGWTCSTTSVTCTLTSSLGAGSSASAITLTVSVASNAVTGTNYVNVSGGGSAGPGSTSDSTTVLTSQTSIVVNNTSDPGSGTLSNCATGNSGTCSLRDALTLANAQGTTATISFSSLFNTAQTITLTSALPTLNVSGENTTITGPGQSLLTISGNMLYPVFSITSGTYAISGLTVSSGKTSANGGCISNITPANLTLTNMTVTGCKTTSTTGGGGIYNTGPLTMSGVTVSNNTSSGAGGGLYNISTALTMSGSTVTGNSGTNGGGLYDTVAVTLNGSSAANTVSNNSASISGGGIYFSPTGTVTVTNFVISGNSAATSGGGIFANTRTTLILNGSTVSGNRVTGSTGTGGGIQAAIATISSSTISGNTSGGNGAGIQTSSTTTVTNSTIANNSATSGIGGENSTLTSTGATLNNVTIVGNTNNGAASDFSGGKLATGGNNVFGTCVANCPTASTNVTSATNLSTLGSYGGAVQTVLPLPGSAAIGGGATCTTATDARGYTRATSGACDAGAVQTSYAATWSTQPPSSTAVATNFTAAVTLMEHGNALSFSGAQTMSLPVTMTGTGTLTGSPLTSLSTAGVASGTFQVSAAGTGDTLTALGTASNSFNIGGSGTTTPSVVVSAASARYGTATTTLGAAVTYTGGTAPTGTFSFQVDSGATVTASCTGSSSPLTCAAGYTVSSLTAGAHTITGTLAADSSFNTASGTNTLTITQIAPAAISWSPGAVKGYAPNAIGAGVLNATDATPGTIAYTATLLPGGSPVTVTSATVLANGSYTLTANFTPTDTTDYTTTSATMAFTQTNMNVFLVGTGQVGSLYNSGAVASSATSGGGIGAAVDSGGYVWSIDSGGTSVAKFTDAGVFSADYSSIGLSGATSLAMDGSSKVWVTNSNGTLTVLSNAGTQLFTVTDTSLSGPTGVAVDSSGNVWVANGTGSSVSEVLGGGTPAAPLATAVTNGTPGVAP